MAYVNKRACCPLCGNTAGTFTHEGRRFYMHHLSNKRDHLLGDDTECEATGWLVEDDEMVTR